MKNLLPCPMPDDLCEGGTGSLIFERDPCNTLNWFGWVKCDWCGARGPTSENLEEATTLWNKLVQPFDPKPLIAKLAVDLCFCMTCDSYAGSNCTDDRNSPVDTHPARLKSAELYIHSSTLIKQ